MERARLVVQKVRLFLSDGDRRRYVLLLVGFLFSLLWLAVPFDDDKYTSKEIHKLRAGAFVTSVIGS